MEGSRAKALFWTLRVIASDVKRSRRILLWIATAVLLDYAAIASVFAAMRSTFAGFFRSAAPFRLLTFLALAESMLNVGQRAEFPVGHVPDRLYDLLRRLVLAGVLRELAGIHREVCALEPVGQISRGCAWHRSLLYGLGLRERCALAARPFLLPTVAGANCSHPREATCRRKTSLIAVEPRAAEGIRERATAAGLGPFALRRGAHLLRRPLPFRGARRLLAVRARLIVEPHA